MTSVPSVLPKPRAGTSCSGASSGRVVLRGRGRTRWGLPLRGGLDVGGAAFGAAVFAGMGQAAAVFAKMCHNVLFIR